jgi:hypothetical protein
MFGMSKQLTPNAALLLHGLTLYQLKLHPCAAASNVPAANANLYCQQKAHDARVGNEGCNMRTVADP